MLELVEFFEHLPTKLKNKEQLSKLLAVPNFGSAAAIRTLKFLAENNQSWSDFWQNKNNVFNKVCKTKQQKISIDKYIKEHEASNEKKTANFATETVSALAFEQSVKDQSSKILAFWEADYPARLKQIDDPPLLLFIKTKNPNYLTILNQSLSLAVVGTRHIDEYGKKVVKKILSQLAVLNPSIVSGFMYGVDIRAHQTALDLGLNTIAVLGFGFNFIYPSCLENYFAQSFKKGVIFLSELPPEKPPKRENFVKRNRLIAALSSGVIIPQAAIKSGSLITANYALNYGKDIFVVPGSIDSPYLAGIIGLANQGAILIQNGQSIWQHLFLTAKHWPSNNNVGLDQPIDNLLALLDRQTQSFNQIAKQLKLTNVRISSLISQLAMAGLVKKVQAKWQINYQENIFSF